jgi:lipoate-protein ligase A
MLKHFYFHMSDSVCPWYNLALEEHILLNLPPETCVLYLYQNQNTVVIGKNQNAWKECRHTLLESEGGKLARRISGGGAVFHDMGNLNFSFIVDKNDYDLSRQLSVILEAVKALGIEAAFSGRNDILSEGAKFSGNAFCYKKTSAFHHGTILIDADMTRLAKYLSVSQDKIVSKGVESVRARVCNLKERNPEITVEKMIGALRESFAKIYGHYEPLVIKDIEAVAAIETRNASWEWKLGCSPSFDIETGVRFPWGGLDFCFSLKDGKVTEAHVYSDALDADFIEALPCVLIGAPFHSKELAQRLMALEGTPERRQMARDMAMFFIEKAY